jgi:hypothetical protein
MGILDQLGGFGSAIKQKLQDLAVTSGDVVIDPDTGQPTKRKYVAATAITPGPKPTPEPTDPNVTAPTSADGPPVLPNSAVPMFRRPGYSMSPTDITAGPAPAPLPGGGDIDPDAQLYRRPGETMTAPNPEIHNANYLQLTARSPVTGEPNPAALGGLSKLGKLLFLGQKMAEGGIVGSTQRGLGHGYEAAQQYENQQAQIRQGLTRGGLENQTAMANLQFMPWRLQQEALLQQAQLGEIRAKTAGERYQLPRGGGVFDTQAQAYVPGTEPPDKPKTVNTGAGPMQYNADTGRYDIPVAGGPTHEAPAPKTVSTGKGQMMYNKASGRYDILVPGGPPRPANAATALTPDQVSNIADAIESGLQPPTLQGLYRNGAQIRAELAARGTNLSRMQTDWTATQKHIATMNGPQFEKLKESITTLEGLLPEVENLYNEWKQYPLVSGYKAFNRAALRAAMNLPGRAGAVASALDSKIADITADLGSVYMGGNTPTEMGLQLGGKALASEWNDETFKEGLRQVKQNIGVRKNSIFTSQPIGVSPNSPYLPSATPTPTGGAKDHSDIGFVAD